MRNDSGREGTNLSGQEGVVSGQEEVVAGHIYNTGTWTVHYSQESTNQAGRAHQLTRHSPEAVRVPPIEQEVKNKGISPSGLSSNDRIGYQLLTAKKSCP